MRTESHEDDPDGWSTRAEPPVGSARSLLLTVLSELVVPHGQPAWTSSLLHVMTRLGLEEQNARQAIARAADAGLIAGEKQGRAVRWAATDAAKAEIAEVSARAESLIKPPERWDGRCLVLSVTIPQSLKTVRKRLYRSLYWQGFGNPAPGLWASPHADRVEELRGAIHELGLDDHTITFIGNTLGVGLTDSEIVARAWDLDDIAARYEKMIQTYEHLDPAPGDDLLAAHLALLNEYREFPAMDPQLPEDLLPNWVGRRAGELFVTLNRQWAPAAYARWLEIVELTSPAA